MSWRITIDQRTASGAFQRYEDDAIVLKIINLGDAIDEALNVHGLAGVEEGDYQITATYTDADRP